MSIKSKIEEHQAAIVQHKKCINDLQSQCSHPIEARTTRNYRTNSEWDATAHYSDDHRCDICGKTWMENA